MKSYILIDCDNFKTKSTSQEVKEFLNSWISDTHGEISEDLELTVRLYGGWYSDSATTDDRGRAVEYYTYNYPTLLKIKKLIVRIKIEFSDYVVGRLHDSNYQINDTLKSRLNKDRLKIDTDKCESSSCEIKLVKRWMNNKKACFSTACKTPFPSAVKRIDQKQVDTHIACDALMLLIKGDCHHLAIASSDIDFAPIFLTAISNLHVEISSIRSSNNTWYVDNILRDNNILIFTDAKL
jgi:uncharacterized LabA/DUF88 family protein